MTFVYEVTQFEKYKDLKNQNCTFEVFRFFKSKTQVFKTKFYSPDTSVTACYITYLLRHAGLYSSLDLWGFEKVQ